MLPIANIIPCFRQNVLISSEHFLDRNNVTNRKLSQQRDLYSNKHFRYPMMTSEKSASLCNFRLCLEIDLIARYHSATGVFC